MALVRVDIYKGKTQEHKKTILDTINEALVEAFKMREDDIYQRLYEFEEENFESFERRNNKSKNFIIIEITAFKGRSKEAKKLLYKILTEKLIKNLGIVTKDVVIYINESDLENWGINGKAADEVDLGFKINV
jgi:4-oxalocrotonate tautomerase family enzyme